MRESFGTWFPFNFESVSCRLSRSDSPNAFLRVLRNRSRSMPCKAFWTIFKSPSHRIHGSGGGIASSSAVATNSIFANWLDTVRANICGKLYNGLSAKMWGTMFSRLSGRHTASVEPPISILCEKGRFFNAFFHFESEQRFPGHGVSRGYHDDCP